MFSASQNRHGVGVCVMSVCVLIARFIDPCANKSQSELTQLQQSERERESPASTCGSLEVVGRYIFGFTLVVGKEAVRFLTGKIECFTGRFYCRSESGS